MTDPSSEPGSEPGTEDARMAGCTCQLRDGEPSDNDRWPDWLTAGCPLHDPNLAGQIPRSDEINVHFGRAFVQPDVV